MKFFQITLILGVCFLGALGCSRSNAPKNSYLKEWMMPSEKIKVLSTTRMIDDLVTEIGGERVLHLALIQGELDPHSYELVKGDHEKMQMADCIFYNGLDLEHGASLKSFLKGSSKSVSLGDHLLEKHEDKLIFLEGQIDPHVWMDVSLFACNIEPIVKQLSLLDPSHKQFFSDRGHVLLEKMKQLDKKIFTQMQAIPETKRYLVTSHDAFFYFTKRYLAEKDEQLSDKWKIRFAAPEGLAPEAQISPKDLQRIIHYAKQHDLCVIFPESNVNQDAIRKITQILGHEGAHVELAKEPLFGDAMGSQDSSAGSYLNMMQHNANVIMKYWKGE